MEAVFSDRYIIAKETWKLFKKVFHQGPLDLVYTCPFGHGNLPFWSWWLGFPIHHGTDVDCPSSLSFLHVVHTSLTFSTILPRWTYCASCFPFFFSFFFVFFFFLLIFFFHQRLPRIDSSYFRTRAKFGFYQTRLCLMRWSTIVVWQSHKLRKDNAMIMPCINTFMTWKYFF